jgi:hypothetical protein
MSIYNLVRRSTFKEECVDICGSREEVDALVSSHRLLTEHLGFITRTQEDGFDVLKDSGVVVYKYRIKENGK